MFESERVYEHTNGRKSEEVDVFERLEWIAGFCKDFSEEIKLSQFFGRALINPYYSPEYENDPLQTIEGHVIYRLSDAVDPELRENILVYPGKEDITIIDEQGFSWYSLEDWRKAWEERHQDIPLLVPQLQEETAPRITEK